MSMDTWDDTPKHCADCGEDLNPDGVCRECCTHDEYDHYICLNCGHEKCPGEDIDAAMDALDALGDDQ